MKEGGTMSKLYNTSMENESNSIFFLGSRNMDVAMMEIGLNPFLCLLSSQPPDRQRLDTALFFRVYDFSGVFLRYF